MHTDSLSYAEYWRNSLADADTGNGAFQDAPKFQKLSAEELSTGLIGQAIIVVCFTNEDEKVQFVEVVIRPKVYVPPPEHGKPRCAGTPAFVTPIVASAKLARDGRLYALLRIVVPRDIWEPLERGSFSIGLVSDQDAFLSTNTIPGIDAVTNDGTPLSNDEFSRQWTSFLAACDQLLEQTGKGWPADEDDYVLAEYDWLVKKESFSVSQHLIALYDHIRDKSPAALPCSSAMPAPTYLPRNHTYLRTAHSLDDWLMPATSPT